MNGDDIDSEAAVFPFGKRQEIYRKDVGSSGEGRSCDSCGSGPLEAIFVGGGLAGWKCKNCDKGSTP